MFIISSHPVYIGSKTTKEEAVEMAEMIKRNLEERYPEGVFRVCASVGADNRRDDPEGEIQQYINDHWLDWV